MHSKFLEIQFPTDISYGSSGGPEYLTNILTTTAGHEYRASKWESPRMKFNIATGIKTHDQIEEIISFFRRCNGREIAFRYKDWTDFKGLKQELIVMDKHTLQIAKSYMSNRRIISKPVLDSVKLYKNGEPILNFKVDYTSGRVTVDEEITPDDVFTADFEFDVPVRFDIDHLPVTIESYGCFSLDEIPVVEVKL